MTGENGETHQVEFLATVKMEDQEYAVLHSLKKAMTMIMVKSSS
jgi:hypothetical protein